MDRNLLFHPNSNSVYIENPKKIVKKETFGLLTLRSLLSPVIDNVAHIYLNKKQAPLYLMLKLPTLRILWKRKTPSTLALPIPQGP